MIRVFAFVASAVIVVACSDPTYSDCLNIPTGGCPGGDTSNCGPTCTSIYSCQANGSWSFVARCPVPEGGLDAATADATLDAPSVPEASPMRDVSTDVPPADWGPTCGSGSNMAADLESPDCPLSQAALCAPSSCCGCEDIWVCLDGGWNVWGECTDGGALMPASSP